MLAADRATLITDPTILQGNVRPLATDFPVLAADSRARLTACGTSGTLLVLPPVVGTWLGSHQDSVHAFLGASAELIMNAS